MTILVTFGNKVFSNRSSKRSFDLVIFLTKRSFNDKIIKKIRREFKHEFVL